MKPPIYTLLGLTLVAIGWFSASATPPAAIAPAPAETRRSAEPLADLPLRPSAPLALEPQFAGQHGHFGDGDLNKAVLGKGRYLQLAQQYADLMTEREISAESAVLEQKILLKRSEDRLWSVRSSLLQITKEFPSTRAAERAQRALEQLDAPVPDNSAPADSRADPTLPTGPGTPPSLPN
jgi:hypothetical protein